MALMGLMMTRHSLFVALSAAPLSAAPLSFAAEEAASSVGRPLTPLLPCALALSVLLCFSFAVTSSVLSRRLEARSDAAAASTEGNFAGFEPRWSSVADVLGLGFVAATGLGAGSGAGAPACGAGDDGGGGGGGGVGCGIGAERARLTRTCTFGACRMVARNNSFTLRVSA